MVLGMKYGQSDKNDLGSRLRTNAVTDEFLANFKAENGSYICKDLLGCDISTQEGVSFAIANNLFVDFCPQMVVSAVKIAEQIISKNN